MSLESWLQRVTKDATEEAPGAAVVRLTTTGDGTVWETWQHPFPELGEFAAQITAVIDAIKAECPVRRIPILLTAETPTGAVLTQHPTSVQGANKNADALAGSGNNAAKAFAEAMEGISRVVVAVLKSSELQVTSLTKTLESQSTQIHDLIEYHRTKQELEVIEQKSTSDAQSMVMEQIKQVLPMIPEALEIFLADRKKSLAADLAGAAVKVVTQTAPTNGVTS